MTYPKSHLRYTWELIKTQKKHASWALVLMIIANLTRVIEPYFYKVIVDTLTAAITAGVFLDSQIQTLVIIILVWAFIAIITNTTAAQQNYLVWHIGNKVSQITHLEGYRRLLRLDFQKHKSKHSSRLCKIIDDADTSTWEMINWWLNSIVPAVISFTAMLMFALTISWQMTIVALSVVPISILIIVKTLIKSSNQQHKINKLWQKKHEHMSDQVVNIATYKLNPNEELFMKRQKKMSDHAANEQLRLNKTWRWLETLKLDILARFLVMGMGIFLLSKGTITLGTLFMFMGLISEIFIPLHVMGDILPQYSRRSRYIERFLKLMNEEDEIKEPGHPKKIKTINGSIEFRDVCFTYDTESGSDVLHKVSFKINPGEQVAIVGHSGAGKSTITGLITRLMDVSKGKILIDNYDIRDYAQEELKSHIGTVLQENAMYAESIAENLSYGDPKASREEIVKAAKLAHADEFISKLPKGYDTKIGERGVRLSGGEKQRISIARAILKNPSIVILDEPTSALDSITEAKVQKGLDALIAGRTSIVIAHRLSTVRNADKIIIIEDGKVLSTGTHRELLHSCETYKEMVQLQTGGFLAE